MKDWKKKFISPQQKEFNEISKRREEILKEYEKQYELFMKEKGNFENLRIQIILFHEIDKKYFSKKWELYNKDQYYSEK